MIMFEWDRPWYRVDIRGAHTSSDRIVVTATLSSPTIFASIDGRSTLAQASADQKIVQSRRAVEIETLKAHAEVEPLRALANQLAELKRNGPQALSLYLRNVRLRLYNQAQRAIMEVKE